MARGHETLARLAGSFAANSPDLRGRRKALGDLAGELQTAGLIRNMDWQAIREEIALHDPGMATKLYALLEEAGMVAQADKS